MTLSTYPKRKAKIFRVPSKLPPFPVMRIIKHLFEFPELLFGISNGHSDMDTVSRLETRIQDSYSRYF